jgi:hypothetical protein
MERRTYLLLGLAALGAGALAVWGLSGSRAEPGADTIVAAAPVSQPTAAASTLPSQNPTLPAARKKTTAQWIADTASGDAKTRATAIEALAEAPRAEALPVLARLLTDGEPQVDRVLALQSIRDLALNQGDADGAVRDAIRRVIYHGDDFSKPQDAQEAIEIIEESLQRQ